MNTSPMMNVVKGVAIGMTAGVCMGIVGKNMVDSNPKLKKKANKAFKTMESVLDTADKIIFIINNPPTQTNRGVILYSLVCAFPENQCVA